MNNKCSQIDQLKLNFIKLDTNKDGYINQIQLLNYMKQMNYNKSPLWIINDAMKILNNQMNQDNFITWILSVKQSLQNLAIFKFNIQKNIIKIQSNVACPFQSTNQTKKSCIEFFINKNQNQPKDKQFNHFFKLSTCMNKIKNQQKRKQISQILKHKPAEIFVQIKFKIQQNGDQIVQKLQKIINVCIQLAAQLGPTVLPIIQNLKFTCKHQNGFIYIIVQLNHTFLEHILEYVNQAMLILSPYYEIQLNIDCLSNFSKILLNNFDYFQQSMNLKAQFQIDKLSLKKIKQIFIQDFHIQKKEDKPTIMLLFLLQELKLSSSFSHLKECFQSLGLQQELLPKPSQYVKNIKQISIKQLIGSFLPECQTILDLLQQSCKPEGQILLFLGNIRLQLNFNVLIQGFFQIF